MIYKIRWKVVEVDNELCRYKLDSYIEHTLTKPFRPFKTESLEEASNELVKLASELEREMLQAEKSGNIRYANYVYLKKESLEIYVENQV